MSTTTAAPPHDDLPSAGTSFIGRRAELSEVQRLISVARLVTLVGVGGVGKTRLALQVAWALRGEFADGVCLVELAHVRHSALLPHTVATALQVPDQTSRPMDDVLADYLAGRRLLLVLDTCEPLVDDCGPFVSELLRASPELAVLATSRQPLGLIGERTFVVQPMEVPDPRRSQDGIDRYDAVALFAARAAEVAPGFAVTADNAPAVTQLCRRLDGIPLAIELAAVRVRELSVGQILARLGDRLQLSGDRDPSIPARHRTLRAAIGWSHELCTRTERLLWTRLSVFPSDFDLDAVEQICTDGELPAEGILDELARLREKSIVLRIGARGDRFRLLDTMREYGQGWAHALDEDEVLRRRHRDYYVRVAEQAEAGWFGPDQGQIFVQMRLEHVNLRAALQYCLTTRGETHMGLNLAGTLWFYWTGCGYLAEGRHWLDRVLTLCPEPSRPRTRALWAAGAVAVAQGDREDARLMLEECRVAAVKEGDDRLVAYAIVSLATVALHSGEFARAISLFKESITRFDAVGEFGSTALMAQAELAFVHALVGDLDDADELAELNRVACERRGDRWALGWPLYVLAFTAWRRGDLARANTLGRACLELQHAFHNLTGMGMLIELLALVTLAGAGDAEAGAGGTVAGAGGTVASGGAAPGGEGAARRVGTGRETAVERAAVLLGAGAAIWRALGRRLFGSDRLNAYHDECEATARRILGVEAYEAAFRRGAELGLDETVKFAMGR